MGFEFIRKIDNLGRILIPVDARRVLGLNMYDEVAIVVENGEIVIKKIHREK